MNKEYSKTHLHMISTMNSLDGKEYIKAFLLYNTALICANLKPAVTLNLMTINDRDLYDLWVKYGMQYVFQMNLDYKLLKQSEDTAIVIIYDDKMLKECLNKKCNADFLKNLGYRENYNLNEKLQMLKKRYGEFKCPHELGIFLGYPVEDVADFIKDSKKRCKMCGYWKVYNSKEKAQKIFNLFDKVKNCAAQNIINGFR